MWTASFPSTISLRVCLFSSVCFWYLWQTSDGYSYMYLCDLFCFCCLWVCFWACTILVFTLDLQYILHSVVVIPHTVLFNWDCFGYIKTSWNIRKKRKEGKYRPISMMNTESKILNKIFENQTWAYIKKLSTMTKMPFVLFSPANKEFCFLFSYYYLFSFLLFPNCSRSGEHGCSGLIPDFNVMTSSVSPFPIVLAVSLPYIAFIVLRYITSRPTHPRTFIMKVYWIWSKRFFFLLYWGDHVIFVYLCF